MVIQRIQTLWLLVAAALSGIFIFLPFAFVPEGLEVEGHAGWLYPVDFPLYMAVEIAATVLYLAAIFMFKRTPLQKRMTLIGLLCSVTVVVGVFAMLFNWGDIAMGEAPVQWRGSLLLPIGSAIFGLLAITSIHRDERLLSSADRLR